MKKIFAAVCISLLSQTPLYAVRPTVEPVEQEAAWIRVYVEGKPGYTYIEMEKDADVMLRQPAKNSVETRQGNISKKLIKDLFQELETADIFDSSQDKNYGRTLFYEGEVTEISAFKHGELRTVRIASVNMPAGLRHAVQEAIKAAKKMPLQKNKRKFITATPFTKSDLENMELKTKSNPQFIEVETYDVEKIKPLSKAISRPYHLTPVESKAAEELLGEFMESYKISKAAASFYIKTSRGHFRCDIVYSDR